MRNTEAWWIVCWFTTVDQGFAKASPWFVAVSREQSFNFAAPASCCSFVQRVWRDRSLPWLTSQEFPIALKSIFNRASSSTCLQQNMGGRDLQIMNIENLQSKSCLLTTGGSPTVLSDSLLSILRPGCPLDHQDLYCKGSNHEQFSNSS